MYAIYGNIYHQYTPNVSIYTSTMDPMGTETCYELRGGTQSISEVPISGLRSRPLIFFHRTPTVDVSP